MSSKSRGLSLNIFGGSGLFNTTSLIIQSENGSSIPHKTNWDSTLVGPTVLNDKIFGMNVVGFSDYSRHQFDSFFAESNDHTYRSYSYEPAEYINDIDMDDDIAVVADKNHWSIEKNTYEIGPSGVTIDAIVKVDLITYTDPNYTPCETSLWAIEIDTTGKPGTRNSGTITFTHAQNCDRPDILSTYTVNVPENVSYTFNLTSVIPITFTTTGSLTGDNINIYFLYHLYIGGNIADCQDVFGNSLGYPIEFASYGWMCAKTNITVQCPATRLNIKKMADILQQQKYLDSHLADNNKPDGSEGLLSNTPMGLYSTPFAKEFPDYSDIYIEIDYTKSVGIDTTVYAFGGFIDSDTYYNKMIFKYNQMHVPGQENYSDAGNYTPRWYMVYRLTTGDYEFVTLDAYQIPDLDPVVNADFEKYQPVPIQDLPASGLNIKYFMQTPLDYGQPLPETELSKSNSTVYLGGVGLLPSEEVVGTSSIRMIKYINYPNCGKVEIYKKKTGKISYAENGWNGIVSSGHGLSNGDCVEFSSALNISNTEITNLNGKKYVTVGTVNSFGIFYDKDLQVPATIYNLKTVSGVRWTAIEPKNWTYKGSLYSPMGKNGYGFIPQLRIEDESDIINNVAFSAVDFRKYAALESSIYIDPNTTSVLKPQSILNNWVSWNNYYPFTRTPVASELTPGGTYARGLYNGNKFGSDIQIQKIKDNKYLLMVTEPGAEVSFPMCDDFILQKSSQTESVEVPNNIFQPPVYLPQGRIHFYTITKDPFNIEYLKSVSHSGNPWEPISYFYQIARDGQYRVDSEQIKQNMYSANIYNQNGDNYWLGGRFYAWNQPYAFDSNYQMSIPNYPKYPNEFGFLDSFGKSAAFDVDASSVYCVASTNVKSAGFDNNTRMTYVDVLSQAFSLDFTSNFNSLFRTSSLSGIIHQSNYYTTSVDSQLIEINKFALNVDFDESKLFIGWPSYARGQESIFIYDRVGSGYQPFQTLTKVGDQNDFGNYFVADNNMLVTNGYNRAEPLFAPTDNPQFFLDNQPPLYNILYIYRQDPFNQQYYLMQEITPTIDLTNPIYQKFFSTRSYLYQYKNGTIEFKPQFINKTTNLSYDNTTGNSATWTIDLQGRYDIYNNSIVMKDIAEIIYYEFDGHQKKFVTKNHKVEDLYLGNSEFNNIAIRMRPSNASYIESYPTSEFIESLNVIGGASYYLIDRSYPRPTYLPLFLKSIEGAPSTGIILQSHGHAPFNSGSILYTQGPIPTGSGMNMFMKMPDLKASGMDLFMKQYLPFETGTTLYTKDQQGIQVMTLHMNPEFNNRIPLFAKVHNYKYNDENGNPIEVDELGNYWQGMYLNIVNRHTGVPNASGYLNLSLRTYESDDTANILNLVINQDYPTSTTGINLFMPDPTGTNRFAIKNDLYLKGPQFIRGTGVDNSLNLVIRRTPEAAMPLTVYNTYIASGLNTYVKGTNLASSGATLYASGAGLPTGSMTVYVDGTVLY